MMITDTAGWLKPGKSLSCVLNVAAEALYTYDFEYPFVTEDGEKYILCIRRQGK